MTTDNLNERTYPTAKDRSADILSRTASFRSRVYRWLALGFYPPEEQLVQALADGRLVDDLRHATLWLGPDQQLLAPALAMLAGLPATKLAEQQQIYRYLFEHGVERISLRERSYRWREAASLLNTPQAYNETLERIYTGNGVKPLGGQSDHAAVELEFLAYLCTREAEYWQIGQFSAARNQRRLEHAFLQEHPGRWLPEVCWHLRQRSQACLYAALAEFGAVWLSLELGPERLAAT
jgi:TorA maturation chaperone TorD